jgi:serine/threonine protein kinase
MLNELSAGRKGVSDELSPVVARFPHFKRTSSPLSIHVNDMHAWDFLDRYSKQNSRWFESSSHHLPTDEYFKIFQEIIPRSWRLQRNGIWFIAEPPGLNLPDQGWKFHLSVSTADAADALRQVLPILGDESVCFKFLMDRSLSAAANGKLWPRHASGKFITVYPETEERFLHLGQQLAQYTSAFSGPYILSDRRWPGSKCLYYRYGGFRDRSVLRVDGLRTRVIAKPNGDLVPDLRLPYWSPPDWVKDPLPLEIRLDDPPSGLLCNGRFAVKSALRFSSRGGVYVAQDNQTGQEVVLKEARPGVEIGRHRIDAVALAARQYRLLQQLAPTGYFVPPVAFFSEWEHAFLVEQFVAGEHLGRFTIRRNPLYKTQLSAAAVSEYLKTMRALWLQLAHAIRTAHDQGIVLGDLSFGNVIVTDASRITIIDLEAAFQEGVDPMVGLFTPGLSHPLAMRSGMNDRASDYYALGAIMLGSLMLASGIISMHPPAKQRYLDALTADLALPTEFCDLINDLLETDDFNDSWSNTVTARIEQLPIELGKDSAAVPRLALPVSQRLHSDSRAQLQRQVAEVVDGITRYLIGTAETSRQDRLFPADPLVFETNPLSVAYGAAGVLYGLKRMRREVPEDLVDWMLHRSINNDDYPPGLYMGQAGIAWVLAEIGHPDPAVECLKAARSHPLLFDSANLLYGASGFGLTCLKFWRAGAAEDFLDEAVRIGHWLVNSRIDAPQGVRWADDKEGRVRLGYALGGSGVALFLLYLYLATGDQQYLTWGRRALDFDLAHAKWVEDTFVGFPDEGIDTPSVPSPYWQSGTAGVATTLIRYLAVAPDAELERWQRTVKPDVSRKYVAFPQLFRGLAGLGNYLIDAWQFTGEEHYLDDAWLAAEGILLSRMERPEGIAFPGEQALRESADFATGATGVGLFLSRLLGMGESCQDNFNFVVDELLPASTGAACDWLHAL